VWVSRWSSILTKPCQASYTHRVRVTCGRPCGYHVRGKLGSPWFKAKHPTTSPQHSIRHLTEAARHRPMASASGPVGPQPAERFVRDPASVFAKDIPVAALVAGVPEASGLCRDTSCRAPATDGWSVLITWTRTPFLLLCAGTGRTVSPRRGPLSPVRMNGSRAVIVHWRVSVRPNDHESFGRPHGAYRSESVLVARSPRR